jgi:hypothetical protein
VIIPAGIIFFPFFHLCFKQYDMEIETTRETPSQKSKTMTSNNKITDSLRDFWNSVSDGPLLRSIIMAVEWFALVGIIIGVVLAFQP